MSALASAESLSSLERLKAMLPILEHARDFLRSVQVLRNYYQACVETRNEPVFSVDVVNLSFAIELLLKALLCSEGLGTHGHNYEKLFQLLPAEMQKQIKDDYELRERSGFMSDPFHLGFDARLKQHASTFEHWRYIYEKTQRTFNSRFCDIFASILNDMTIKQEARLRADLKPNGLRVDMFK